MTDSSIRLDHPVPVQRGAPPVITALLTVRQVGSRRGVPVCSVRGELDMATAPMLKGHLAEIEQARPARLVVDLSRVVFLSAAGVGVLVHAAEQAALDGRRMDLVASGPAHRVLALCGVTQQLAMYPRSADAVNAGSDTSTASPTPSGMGAR